MGHKNVRVTNLDAEFRPVAGAPDAALAISNAAVTVNQARIHVATKKVLYGLEGDVRVKFDGTAPDANTGIWLRDGSSGTMAVELFLAAQFIRKGSADAVLSFTQLG